MPLTNDELTEQLRDLKKRVKDLEEQLNIVLWQQAMKSLEEVQVGD